MTIGVLLTILFVALKLTGSIAWTWFWVLSPLIIEIGIDLLMLLGFGAFAFWLADD